jgi:hypothetical protein
MCSQFSSFDEGARSGFRIDLASNELIKGRSASDNDTTQAPRKLLFVIQFVSSGTGALNTFFDDNSRPVPPDPPSLLMVGTVPNPIQPWLPSEILGQPFYYQALKNRFWSYRPSVGVHGSHVRWTSSGYSINPHSL